MFAKKPDAPKQPEIDKVILETSYTFEHIFWHLKLYFQDEKDKNDKKPLPIDFDDKNHVPESVSPSTSKSPELTTRLTTSTTTEFNVIPDEFPVDPDEDRDEDPDEDEDNNMPNEVHTILLGHKQVTPASFFARPGILAGIIFNW